MRREYFWVKCHLIPPPYFAHDRLSPGPKHVCISSHTWTYRCSFHAPESPVVSITFDEFIATKTYPQDPFLIVSVTDQISARRLKLGVVSLFYVEVFLLY